MGKRQSWWLRSPKNATSRSSAPAALEPLLIQHCPSFGRLLHVRAECLGQKNVYVEVVDDMFLTYKVGNGPFKNAEWTVLNNYIIHPNPLCNRKFPFLL